MIPNFNPNKWDREKIIEYVIGDEPLDDQQLAFLNYFDKLQKEKQRLIDYLKNKIKEYQFDEKLSYKQIEKRVSVRLIYQEILDFVRRW